jgi:hypothetical protein
MLEKVQKHETYEVDLSASAPGSHPFYEFDATFVQGILFSQSVS